jgi:hypothetical protein
MGEVLYRCPRTRRYAQGWIADDASATADQHTFLSVVCPACGVLHMVNPDTRKVLGDDDSRSPRRAAL